MHRCNSIEAVKHGLKGHMDFDLSLKPHFIQSVLLTNIYFAIFFMTNIVHTHTQRGAEVPHKWLFNVCVSSSEEEGGSLSEEEGGGSFWSSLSSPSFEHKVQALTHFTLDSHLA